ncbi:hypothetical protein [Williamsia sp. D3]|uniref:hypothetical protein n=1 Tax=Williamsia sp. D3 TaxID=1313067 RepID=UPI0003D36D14|nr:hypothetical protein W823_09495 [Williamsia sp. D3]
MKSGTRALSAVCDTEVMVIRAADVDLFCGGAPMVTARDGRTGSPEAGLDNGTLLGKRYVHASSGLEVLCVKAGAGTLSVDGEPLTEVAAKQLPSSD